jgi:hypothetical protein
MPPLKDVLADYQAQIDRARDRIRMLGSGDARAQQFLPGQFGVAAMRLFHARHPSGHGDRAGTMRIAVINPPRPGEDVGGRTSLVSG